MNTSSLAARQIAPPGSGLRPASTKRERKQAQAPPSLGALAVVQRARVRLLIEGNMLQDQIVAKDLWKGGPTAVHVWEGKSRAKIADQFAAVRAFPHSGIRREWSRWTGAEQRC